MSTSNQDQPPKRCSSCVHCLTFEYGYSNWTVEGKTRVCMLHKHPEPEFDNWYDENPADRYAEQCDSFERGEGPYLDVDREDIGDLSPEARAWLDSEQEH